MRGPRCGAKIQLKLDPRDLARLLTGRTYEFIIYTSASLCACVQRFGLYNPFHLASNCLSILGASKQFHRSTNELDLYLLWERPFYNRNRIYKSIKYYFAFEMERAATVNCILLLQVYRSIIIISGNFALYILYINNGHSCVTNRKIHVHLVEGTMNALFQYSRSVDALLFYWVVVFGF